MSEVKKEMMAIRYRIQETNDLDELVWIWDFGKEIAVVCDDKIQKIYLKDAPPLVEGESHKPKGWKARIFRARWLARFHRS